MKYKDVKVGMKVRYDATQKIYVVSKKYKDRTTSSSRPIELKGRPNKSYKPEWLTFISDNKMQKLKEKMLG